MYELNLIDTPGHVDFNYEVSRSLAACEGALLVVDATQGVEAQTLANVYLALDHDHEIVPVLNKIDLPSAEVDRVKAEIEESIGLDCAGALPVSAKTGMGVDAVLEAIVHRLPAPHGDEKAPLKALIFDSWYDSYQGVVILFRVMDGAIKLNEIVRLMSTGKEYEVLRLGVFFARGHRRRRTAYWRSGLYVRLHQGPGRRPRGRHHHPCRQPGLIARARLYRSEAHGFLRSVPHGIRRIREPQNRSGKAAAQRRGLFI